MSLHWKEKSYRMLLSETYIMKRSVETIMHPGIILKEEVLEANDFSISAGAGLLGVTRLTLSKIVNEKGSITPNNALRIEKVFGGNADFWLRMQRGYDLLEIKKFKKNPPPIRKYDKAREHSAGLH